MTKYAKIKLAAIVLHLCCAQMLLHAEDVTLVQIVGSGGEGNRVWTINKDELIQKSSWKISDALPLSPQQALKLARLTVPDDEVMYINIRRPVQKIDYVFFYHISFSDHDVVVLMNGDVVLSR